MASPAQTALLENIWSSFYSTEPDFPLRATIGVAFPTPTSLTLTKVAHFSELGLGDDVSLTLTSPVTMNDGFFVIPASQSQTLSNPQGRSASLALRAGPVGYTLQWGNRVMSMFSRDFQIAGLQITIVIPNPDDDDKKDGKDHESK